MANFILIRKIAEEKNITIRELASRVNKDETTIQAIIRKGSTNTSTLEEIAKVLDVPVGIFFDNSSSVPPITIERMFAVVESQQKTIENQSIAIEKLTSE